MKERVQKKKGVNEEGIFVGRPKDAVLEWREELSKI